MPERTQQERLECNKNEKSAFDRLLDSNPGFYWTMCRQMDRKVARMELSQYDRERVVDDAWFKAVKHRHFFEGEATERRLRCWLLKVVHCMAVDAVRRRVAHPTVSIDSRENTFIDNTAARRAKTAELHEWFNVLLQPTNPDDEKNLDLLRAHYLQQVSIQKLAQSYGMTVNSVDKRIRRRVDRLRPMMV